MKGSFYASWNGLHELIPHFKHVVIIRLPLIITLHLAQGTR